MALQERSILSQCEVLPNGIIQVRISNQIVDGEIIKASSYHRCCLHPGDDLTNQPQLVVTIANAIWTPDVVAAYTANQQLSAIVKRQENIN